MSEIATEIPAGVPTSYDLVPYESHPHASTHVEHLYTIGRLFGMTPPDFRRVRVLELGSAAGGNLIPMALGYPDSRFLGIDLSGREVEHGQRQIADLGLGNIELRQLSIMDVDKSFGAFDYIICHGVYSWVPPAVQDKILAICQEQLAPDGIALVSYNTLPGWNTVRTVREMMLYHAARFVDPTERVRQARQLLDFVREAGGDSNSPYMGMLQQEIDLLRPRPDSYLLHDHLEENNTPIYFHQFIARAREKSLQYLGDSSLASMYAGNLPPATAEKLATVGDIVRQEQYMDFMNNRRFRTTLLCRAAVALDRKLTAARFEPFYWRSLLVPETPGEAVAQASDGNLSFAVPGTSIRLKTGDPVTGAAFQVLSRYRGLPVKPADVVREVVERHGIADTTKIRSALGGAAARLVFAGGIRLHSQGPTWTAEPSQHPMASPLARHQARQLNWLTNQRHEPVRADAVWRVLVQHLDGRHDRPALAERLIDQLRKGELTLQHEGRPVTDAGEIAQRVAAAVDLALGRLAENALLVA
jgi:methyltransferase-like protein/SAM-dependent methyltransferase